MEFTVRERICEASIVRRSMDGRFPRKMELCGAIDERHVIMQTPPNSSSLYFNYKKKFSVVLMAACDTKYKLTLVDIGDTGR